MGDCRRSNGCRRRLLVWCLTDAFPVSIRASMSAMAMQKFHLMAALWLAGAAAGAGAQTAGTGKTGKPSGSAVNDTAGRCATIADENEPAMCRDAAGLGKPKK